MKGFSRFISKIFFLELEPTCVSLTRNHRRDMYINKYLESGYYAVDPDGPGVLEPIMVHCDFDHKDPNNSISTVSTGSRQIMQCVIARDFFLTAKFFAMELIFAPAFIIGLIEFYLTNEYAAWFISLNDFKEFPSML